MRPTRSILFAALALSSCVQPRTSPPPQAPPVSRPVPPPTAVPAANWSDRNPAPGIWTYTRDSRGSLAMFGEPGTNATFTIRCARDGNRIFVSRLGRVAARMTLRSTTDAKNYNAMPTGGDQLYIAAELAARDPQLDSLAFSRGRILIGLEGASDLIMPIWPEFTRVVEDCRG